MSLPVKVTLCKLDEQGRLVLPEEVVRRLKSKGFKAAIISDESEVYRLEFYPDEDSARAIMFAREDMEKHPAVYEALAKS